MTTITRKHRTPVVHYATETVELYQDKLSKAHFAILMLASASDYQAIAHVLSIPVGTVKSRLNRARAAMAKAIEVSGKERAA